MVTDNKWSILKIFASFEIALLTIETGGHRTEDIVYNLHLTYHAAMLGFQAADNVIKR